MEPAPAARLASIDGIRKFILASIGDAVKSDQAIDIIAEHVFSKSYGEHLLRSCLNSLAKGKRRGTIKGEPGWYFLTLVQASAKAHVVHLARR